MYTASSVGWPIESVCKRRCSAQNEFFHTLQRAPGFTGFHLVVDQTNGIKTAIIIWESKVQTDAFADENSAWMHTLDQLGHTLQSDLDHEV